MKEISDKNFPQARIRLQRPALRHETSRRRSGIPLRSRDTPPFLDISRRDAQAIPYVPPLRKGLKEVSVTPERGRNPRRYYCLSLQLFCRTVNFASSVISADL